MGRKPTIRNRVMRIARERFLKEGFYKVSMDSLVKDLRTSKSSVYNHFESKEVLVKAILMELNTEINQKLAAVLADDKLTFKGKLVAIADYTRNLLTEVSEAFLSDLELYTPDIWDWYQAERRKRIDKYYKALFRRGMDAGNLREDTDLELVVSVYMALTDIPLRYEHVNHIGLPQSTIYEQITEIFLHGIMKRS